MREGEELKAPRYASACYGTRNGYAQGLSLRAWHMYIDVSSSTSAPQLNILVNDIPIV